MLLQRIREQALSVRVIAAPNNACIEIGVFGDTLRIRSYADKAATKGINILTGDIIQSTLDDETLDILIEFFAAHGIISLGGIVRLDNIDEINSKKGPACSAVDVTNAVYDFIGLVKRSLIGDLSDNTRFMKEASAKQEQLRKLQSYGSLVFIDDTLHFVTKLKTTSLLELNQQIVNIRECLHNVKLEDKEFFIRDGKMCVNLDARIQSLDLFK